MITFDEAARLIGQLTVPLGKERVSLRNAGGRVLASPVIARIDSPRFDQSAMDGYAVRSADLPDCLAVNGESFPGAGFEGTVAPGTCVRIFTGAPVPEGADRVVIQENVERTGDRVTIGAAAGNSTHIRAAGSDFRAGRTLLEPGDVLNPRLLVAAAAADVAEVEVHASPRVVILATGDELVDPGAAHLTTNRIPESVSFGISAMVVQWGGHVVSIRRLADELPGMKRAAHEAVESADLVVVTGGASVGERDFAKAMFADLGLETVFAKVAMKPGKPVWLGRVREQLVMGLPGNPTSAMVTARLLLAPLLAGLAGRGGALDWSVTKLAGPLAPCGDRETFVRARRLPGGALPVDNQDSGAQLALVASDLLLRCAPNTAARQAGDEIEAIAF